MIDYQLLKAYIAELDALRAHGREFSRMHPDIAARLDIGPRASRDPHVERVVESSAFLAARLRLMIETTATELPLSVLTVLAPALVEPVPSMAVAEFVGGGRPQEIPRGTRLDCSVSGLQVCFRTTMPITAAPMAVHTELLDATAGFASGIVTHFSGVAPPNPLLLYLGSDDRTASVLMDALDENLVSVSVVTPDGRRRELPRSALKIHGLAAEEAVLPLRRIAHSAHRIVTEFLVFPEKFRFISVRGANIPAKGQLQFRFNAPLALRSPAPADMLSVNRAPVINLWDSAGTPIDVNGRQLEYPVSVDTLRYRTVDCHSVESVELFSSASSKAEPLDPIMAFGDVRGSGVRWGVRRTVSSKGNEVLLYFQGLDYSVLGRERHLVVPRVLASNRDLAHHLPAGASLAALEGLGGWQGRLVIRPTRPINAMTGETAMMDLIGYLRSGIAGLITEARTGALRSFLKRFPGGAEANWIDSIGRASVEPVTVLRHGQPQPGTSIRVQYHAARQTTTSRAMVRRVIGQLLESQRGLNRIEEVRLDVS